MEIAFDAAHPREAELRAVADENYLFSECFKLLRKLVYRERSVIAQALALNKPQVDDALDVLAKLGGFDIAGMCGLFLGGAVHQVPVIVDGLISAVAAYVAWRLRPGCRYALLASHVSAEPAAALLLGRMGLQAPIHAGMRLGEGTGAVSLIPLLDMALSLYRDGTTFEGCGLVPYEVRSA